MRAESLLIALLVTVAHAFQDEPLMCISDPPMRLTAGTTVVSATEESLYGQKCRALLEFADPNFVPIAYSFTPAVPCSGPRVNSFLVPPGAPNGNARIIWQCKRSLICSLAVVSDGTGDRSLVTEQNGTMGCLPLNLGTNISTTINQQPQTSSITNTVNSSLGWNGTSTSSQISPTSVTQISSATRALIPPWTIVTITHTVTTLLTSTLAT